MNYEELLLEADQIGVTVKEKPLSSGDGRIKGKRIAIRKDISTSTEKSCVLSEELGHYHKNAGNILDQSDTANRKQELKARLWGYNRKIGLLGIIKAFEHGCRSKHEAAEYLDVTLPFLEDAIECYRNKYGIYTTVDRYIIYFIPNLSVAKIF